MRAWYSQCRAVWSGVEYALPKLVDSEAEPIQIDESYFAGRRKYNRGRLSKGDKRRSGETEARAVFQAEDNGFWSVDPEDEQEDERSG